MFRPPAPPQVYSSVTDRRLKMGRRRPSKQGESEPPELREQEEVYPSSERESAEAQRCSPAAAKDEAEETAAWHLATASLRA